MITLILRLHYSEKSFDGQKSHKLYDTKLQKLTKPAETSTVIHEMTVLDHHKGSYKFTSLTTG